MEFFLRMLRLGFGLLLAVVWVWFGACMHYSVQNWLKDFWERDFWDTTLFTIPFEWILPLLLGYILFEILWWFWLPSVLEKFPERCWLGRIGKFLLGVWMLRLFVMAGFAVLGIIHFYFPGALSPWLPDWFFED